MRRFAANHSKVADTATEARLRTIEEFLYKLPKGTDEALTGLTDTTGGGQAAVAAASGSGGGGGSTSLAGDVTGPAGSNTVEKVRNLSFEEPDSADDEKFLKYQHGTTSYEWSHIDRIQNVAIAAPAALDNGRSITYNHSGPNFTYGPGFADVVCLNDEVIVSGDEVVWLL